MTYIITRKHHFRITEAAKPRWKQLVSPVGFVFVLLCCSLFSLPSQAQTPAETSIRQAVQKHLKKELRQAARQHHWKKYTHNWEIWLPDSAAHLPACQQKLNITQRDNQQWPVGRLKRMVQCTDPKHPWRLNVTIKASLTLPVVVAKQTVKHGSTIQASMLALEKRKIIREASFLTHTSQVKGKVAIRRLRSGQIINPVWLEKPPLVLKGNQVLIVATKGGFTASTKGVAMEQGAKGEQIKVRNSQSKKIIRAIVSGKNEVHTQF